MSVHNNPGDAPDPGKSPAAVRDLGSIRTVGDARRSQSADDHEAVTAVSHVEGPPAVNASALTFATPRLNTECWHTNGSRRDAKPLVLIAVTGEKGGGGKTPVALLTSTFLQRKWSWRGVDLDGANKQFAASTPNHTQGFTLSQKGELVWDEIYRFGDFIAEAMTSETVDAVIVDLGGGQLELFETALVETRLVDLIGDGIVLAMFYNLIADHGSMSTLRNNMNFLDRFEHGAHWVVVRNAWKGALAEYDDGKVIRPHLRGRGAFELDLLRLRDEAAIQMWGRSRKLLDDHLAELTFTKRAVLASWSSHFFKQLDALPFLSGDFR